MKSQIMQEKEIDKLATNLLDNLYDLGNKEFSKEQLKKMMMSTPSVQNSFDEEFEKNVINSMKK